MIQPRHIQDALERIRRLSPIENDRRDPGTGLIRRHRSFDDHQTIRLFASRRISDGGVARHPFNPAPDASEAAGSFPNPDTLQAGPIYFARKRLTAP
ncbi:MAG TPA: hypothetical protein VN157_10410 [Caulobacter sp.]|nr:hypothetical protein [Caulobacter sp.]